MTTGSPRRLLARNSGAFAPSACAIVPLRKENHMSQKGGVLCVTANFARRRQLRVINRKAQVEHITSVPGSESGRASARTRGGISKLIAFVALRLITSEYLVGWITGKSAGFSPLR